MQPFQPYPLTITGSRLEKLQKKERSAPVIEKVTPATTREYEKVSPTFATDLNPDMEVVLLLVPENLRIRPRRLADKRQDPDDDDDVGHEANDQERDINLLSGARNTILPQIEECDEEVEAEGGSDSHPAGNVSDVDTVSNSCSRTVV